MNIIAKIKKYFLKNPHHLEVWSPCKEISCDPEEFIGKLDKFFEIQEYPTAWVENRILELLSRCVKGSNKLKSLGIASRWKGIDIAHGDEVILNIITEYLERLGESPHSVGCFNTWTDVAINKFIDSRSSNPYATQWKYAEFSKHNNIANEIIISFEIAEAGTYNKHNDSLCNHKGINIEYSYTSGNTNGSEFITIAPSIYFDKNRRYESILYRYIKCIKPYHFLRCNILRRAKNCQGGVASQNLKSLQTFKYGHQDCDPIIDYQMNHYWDGTKCRVS